VRGNKQPASRCAGLPLLPSLPSLLLLLLHTHKQRTRTTTITYTAHAGGRHMWAGVNNHDSVAAGCCLFEHMRSNCPTGAQPHTHTHPYQADQGCRCSACAYVYATYTEDVSWTQGCVYPKVCTPRAISLCGAGTGVGQFSKQCVCGARGMRSHMMQPRRRCQHSSLLSNTWPTLHTHTQACRSLDSSSTINCESGTAVHLLRLVCHTETQYMTPPQGLHTHSTLVVCGVWGPARCRCSCSSSSGEKQLVPENLKADVLHCCACSWLPLLPDLPARLSVCLPVCLSASHVYWGALNGL
jgi:hypothetical protein